VHAAHPGAGGDLEHARPLKAALPANHREIKAALAEMPR
jgi:hypothetical protein